MENPIYNIRRDTGAWRVQVWISFGIAVLVCGSGLAWLPGADLDRAFMVMGYFFCLSAAFALSKYVRDKAIASTDTPMWGLVVWGGFALAMALTGWGLWRMEINPTWKAYLLVSWLYLISSAFTLAKTLPVVRHWPGRIASRASRAWIRSGAIWRWRPALPTSSTRWRGATAPRSF
jgi:hypothetical protein